MSRTKQGSQPPIGSGGLDPNFVRGVAALRDFSRLKKRVYGKFAGIVELAHQQESQRENYRANEVLKWLRKRGTTTSDKQGD